MAKKITAVWVGPQSLRPFLIDVSTITADPENARFHDDKNLRAIESAIAAHGQTQLLSVYDGKVLVGNGRLSVMLKMGWTHIAAIDVTTYFATKEQATAYAIGDNRASELGTWDLQGLSHQLAALPAEALPWTAYEGFEWNVLIESSKKWDQATSPKPQKPEGTFTAVDRQMMKSLKVLPTEALVIKEAIDKVKADAGDGHMKDGRAIELMCGEFLS